MPPSPPLLLPLPGNIDIGIKMLSSRQIFTRDIKKEKVTLSVSRHKRILNKIFFYEHSNIEEREGIL